MITLRYYQPSPSGCVAAMLLTTLFPLQTPPRYDFNYAVNDNPSGNNYNAQETRDGYDTQGSYYVQLPDGRLQRVTYTVNGDSGFVADVAYEGEARYSEGSYAPAPAPSYRPAPTPSYQ